MTAAGGENALEPLRVALLARARADATAARASAEESGRRTLAAAQREAESMLADARARGEQDAADLLAAQRSRSRRAARAVVLDAQRAAYDELRTRARAAIRELLTQPARRTRFEAVVRGRLGDSADVRNQPDGGLVAQAPDGRRVDASVHALVDAALTGLDVEQLWAP